MFWAYQPGRGKVVLGVIGTCLLPLLIANCGGTSSSPSASSNNSKTTPNSASSQITQTPPPGPPPAAAPGPHSKMLPEITLPAGSSEEAHNTPGDETWYLTTPYDQTLAMLKAQLPIGQTFRGVPWCKGDTSPVSPDINAWEWSTDTEALTVFAQRAGLRVIVKTCGLGVFRRPPRFRLIALAQRPG
jgi:hypothetical protein